ncbi:redoxin domain-containing protein [Candidatus Peregrinibacteria bacterium]|nr:redoxin domain-containing protein [Candidatus Peregrinibacteria bacterium]
MVLLESFNVPLGTKAPDFMLKGIDDKEYSKIDFADKQVLVIVFMCNHCPYVQAVWERLNALQDRFREKGIQFIGINPNLNPDYPEEDLEHMKEYAEDYDMNFPYLLDESQNVARDFEAKCTPDIFVYNKSRELIYHGRIDDNWQDEAAVESHDLADFLEAHLNGRDFGRDQVPSMGCSIKWREA